MPAISAVTNGPALPYRAAVTIFLIRHAHAGNRKSWAGPDEGRPLSEKGTRQAEAIAERFAGEGIDQVVSSPSLRCRQTVEPLARQLGTKVRDDEALAEGSSVKSSLALLRRAIKAGGDVALCSHGDVIPNMMSALQADGLKGDGTVDSAKGGTFVLQTKDGRVASSQYVPPPDVGAGTSD
jgi:phosphohistidine phosphatase SixA